MKLAILVRGRGSYIRIRNRVTAIFSRAWLSDVPLYKPMFDVRIICLLLQLHVF